RETDPARRHRVRSGERMRHCRCLHGNHAAIEPCLAARTDRRHVLRPRRPAYSAAQPGRTKACDRLRLSRRASYAGLTDYTYSWRRAKNMRLILSIAFILCGAAPALAADAKPNVVLVFIDDMGSGDLSCFGNKDVETEHIDRLAAEGIRFEQFYVNS